MAVISSGWPARRKGAGGMNEVVPSGFNPL
jgi:hypothetical protein